MLLSDSELHGRSRARGCRSRHCAPVAGSSRTAARARPAFGRLALVLAVAAYLVSARTFVSVWCLFAAALSGLILIHFSGPVRDSRLISALPPAVVPL